MKTQSVSSRFKMYFASACVLAVAALWANSGMAGKLSGSTVEGPAASVNVQDKKAEQDLREKVFLHRLSMNSSGVVFAHA